MRFSERYGHVEVSDALQLDDMDDALRTALWNAFYLSFFFGSQYAEAVDAYCHFLWASHFKQALNESPGSRWEHYFHSQFKGLEWYEIYDLIEAMIEILGEGTLRSGYTDRTNLALENERAGYRLIDGLITPIVAEDEIATIEGALDATTGLPGARHHLQTALALLANRTDPDYANSIKESMSAVESICSSIVGKKSTLAQALKRLNDHVVDIHPALEGGWSALYGYTSDDDGIRHGGQTAPTVELEDATYFLIACSAFVNLLIAKCARAGVALSPIPE